jgi:hypothetical protein
MLRKAYIVQNKIINLPAEESLIPKVVFLRAKFAASSESSTWKEIITVQTTLNSPLSDPMYMCVKR